MDKKKQFGKFGFGEVLLAGYAHIFARRLLVPLHRLMFHVSIRGLGVFNYQNFHISGEHYLVRRLLPKLLASSTSPILFDVGANEGSFSEDLVSAFPEASIYSFEPHRITFARLKSRVGGRCQVFNYGLGDMAGSMKLYDVGGHEEGTSHASLYADVISDIHHREIDSVDVEIKTLDDVAVELGIAKIDFLKIDTEGNELSVLKGARRLLLESNVGVIHFEFNEMNVVSRCFMRDFAAMLKEYKLFRLLPKSLLELSDMPALTEIFGFQNIIAIKKNHEYLKARGV